MDTIRYQSWCGGDPDPGEVTMTERVATRRKATKETGGTENVNIETEEVKMMMGRRLASKVNS